MLKAGFISLGCAKNLVDSEIMLGLLNENNITITEDPSEADILIINTCSFIDTAKEESISTILQMAQYKKEGKCRGIIVAGCLGQRYQEGLLDEMPEIDGIIGTGAWHRVVEAIQEVMAGKRVLFLDSLEKIMDDAMPRITTTPFYTAYIKVADGCSNCCSYCIIPKVRGAFHSRPIESVVNEAKNLAAHGVKEINLIAQDTTSYGKDIYGEPQLVNLLKKLVQVEGIKWIRLLYCYPKYFSDELIDIIAREPKICKYVDLPLQHAHDDILKAMNRKDSCREVENLLAKMRNRINGLVVRTSLIVGFPGETEEHFKFLCDFIERQKFEHVGVFPYSREEDTPASEMPDQVPDEIKQERYHQLMALQCRISEEINRELEETELDVLVAGNTPDQPEVMYGRSYREAPDVDGYIYVEGADSSKPGEIIKTKIIQGFTYDILAEKIK